MILSESSFWNYLFDTHHIIEFGGIFLILAIIYIETGFFLGFVLPGGDYMLFAAGIFCGTHYLDIPLFWLVLLLITASFLGDFTGYFKGKDPEELYIHIISRLDELRNEIQNLRKPKAE